MSSFHFFDGKALFAQVQRPNKFNKWSVHLIVDPATRKAIKSLGTRLNVKETDDGEFFYTFTRPTTLRKRDGTTVDIDPPKVIDADGNPLDALIGNGSDVTVKIEVYDFQAGTNEKTGQSWDAGKGTRLVGIQVKNLIEYKKEEVKTDEKEMPF